MKTIVFDHVRRWWWLWLGCGACCILTVGVGHPLKPDLSNLYFFPLAMYLGVVQLSQDLRRGDMPRILRTLPVSAKEIGRAWWWASVGLPAVTLTGLTGLIYLFLACMHRPVSGAAFLNYAATNVLLFGPPYYFFTGIPAGNKGFGGGLRGFCCSVLFGIWFLGMLYFYRFFHPYTIQWDIFVVAASALTLASWFGVEAHARQSLGSLPTRTDQKYATALALEALDHFMAAAGRRLPGNHALSAGDFAGPGGLRFLFQSLFYPAFGLGLFMVLFIGFLFCRSFGSEMDRESANIFWAVLSMTLWFAELNAIPRVLMQTRWLRTLPIKPTPLAAVFIFAPMTAMLAFMCLGNLILGVIHPLPEMSFFSMLRQGCLVQIALTTLVVPLVLWRGLDALVLAIVMVLMTSCALGAFYIPKYLSLPANLASAMLIIIATHLITIRLWNAVSVSNRPRTPQLQGIFGGAE